MAHKKAGGSTRNGRDSQAKRLGVKVGDGMPVLSGSIIIRQKGTNYFPGVNTKMGNDFTIFAVSPGKVHFQEKARTRFDGRIYKRKYVSVQAELSEASPIN